MNKKWLVVLLAPLLLGNNEGSGCDDSTQKERKQVEQQQERYVTVQPPPYFEWSLERHLLTELYKARNNSVATYTYVRNQYTGKVMSWCPSIGFPISAATQLTNPMAVPIGHSVSVPQAEPNGLYTPAASRGTFVMCLNKDGKVVPRYHEEDVEAFLTPMIEKDGMLVEADGAVPSVTIDPKRP